jgi:hypothetical protein
MCTIETKDCFPSGHIDCFNNLIPTRDAFEECNMANISPIVKIGISIKLVIVEEITIGATCSPEELIYYKSLFQEYWDIFVWSYMKMPDLDPSIFEHQIDTCLDVSPIRQKKCPLHPSKYVDIKYEIDKLHTVEFIYPIAYTSWVSNLVSFNKKKDIICVCTDFHDLNHACPKEKFPTPFIDQIFIECVDHEALFFMDGFSSYNQIQIHPANQYKTSFTTFLGTFSYGIIPF